MKDRNKYSIKDENLKELVRNIFIVIDQPFWDIPAKKIADMICEFIEKDRKY